MYRTQTLLHYKLPSTIEAIQQNWADCMKGSTIISGLLAVVSAILLLLFNVLPAIDASQFPRKNSTALEILSYASLFLNISSGLSSVLLLDRLGQIPYEAATEPQPQIAGRSTLTSQELLRVYKIGRTWGIVLWHWLFCLIGGVGCLLAELVVHAWSTESRQIKIVIACLSVFCLAPVFLFFLSSLFSGLTKSDNVSDIDIESARTPSPVSTKQPIHKASSSFKTPNESFGDTGMGLSVAFSEPQGHFRVDTPTLTLSPRLPHSPTGVAAIPR